MLQQFVEVKEQFAFWGGQLSLATTWVLGMEPGFSGLVARSFSN